MKATESHTTGTSILVELPSGERYLVVDLMIDCPACGTHTVRFAGHHLRAIRDFVTETIDQYPEHTLKEGDVRTVERLSITGPPHDPESN